MVGLMIFMTCGMFSLMTLMTMWLPKRPPISPPPPVPVATVAAVQPTPEGIVVGLIAVAPAAGLPGAVPWASLAQSARKETFHILEDADLDKLLTDLKSRHPAIVEQAAKGLAAAAPDESRRKETALALEEALANPFPMAKIAAAEALGNWGTLENEPALVKLAGDHNPRCRAAAAAALAAIKSRS
jgi:HEAT repeat protein